MTNQAVLSASQLSKSFTDGQLKTDVLNNINLTVNRSDRIAIVGSSGSGKSTLLHILGGLDSPTEGQVLVQGNDIHAMKNKAASRLRNQQLGFVYQFHHLLPEFTAVENVAMPLVIGGMSPSSAQQRATELLDKVGLGHRFQHKPSELSGGERQRAALARALITEPACLLADEPTGNLDHRTAQAIFDLILKLNEDFGTALVIVTHDTGLAAKMDQQLTLIDGCLAAGA
ncbi:MAG TPA: lipoprotein-releasing ABC transporter ATP-binding protein LolD [Methylophaga aminisulfidivorans]|jgi:lipoprotein-releasing system ATP-binding protein|uniref:lipoprotein-releasing ABC transporter ATP-binding protein LolD n=1 Tax=Methylophaga TaxID=40222 RepID=UPI00176AC6DC|nr:MULTISPECIES: lipoprotein-releasing ABC transporter ATP-binding protein LolD [Methylophaga]HIC46102.1 lipoprotein-releasing ABC transporter ATP-binding protein LolD [Methylophaga sp.]HIM39214.1 lipoprotein-releasing ABC transporter ATP-binding protein LolD [Methylophaga aminisulfidivorans]